MVDTEGIVRRPGPVNLRSGNVSAEWERFKQKFDIYLIATKQSQASSQEKWALLLGEAGDDALDVFNAFKDKLRTQMVLDDGTIVTVDQSQDYVTVMEQFNKYAEEKKSLTLCREQFNQRNQKPREPFTNWLTDLRNLVKPCEYGEITDSMLKDRIVWGTRNRRLKDAVRAKPSLSLQEVIDLCKAQETVSGNQEDAEASVETLQTRRPENGQTQNGQIGFNRNYRGRQNYRRGTWNRGRGHTRGMGHRPNRQEKPKYMCKKCNTWHGVAKCPAYGKKCLTCHQFNHFSRVCRNKPGPGEKRSEVIETPKPTEGESDLILDSWALEVETMLNPINIVEDDDVLPSKRGRKEYTEVLKLGGEYYIRFKLDPGSEVNVLPLKVFIEMNKNKKFTLYKTEVLLRGFDKNLSSPEGAVNLFIETKHGDKKYSQFFVSKVACRPILGIEDCEKLRLIQRVNHSGKDVASLDKMSGQLSLSQDDFIKQNVDVFSGLGRFKQTIKILIDPSVQPQMCPPRRYNYSIVERLQGKLIELEKMDVIVKITDEIPKFVSNLVIREKANGDLRICLDPASLNKAIIKPNYIIPTLEEIACKVKDKKVFSVLDLKDGFWHARLDYESSLLCTFATPYGLYRFKTMPFGLKCAPEIFQFLTEQALQGTGAHIYFDDVLIAGKDYAEHDEIMMKVLEKARSETVRFNPGKLQFRMIVVKFIGMLWSLNQIKIHPERISAIQAIKDLKTKKQLEKVLGVLNYLRKFVPQIAELAAPLQELLSKTTIFQWLPVHAENFQKLKDSVTVAPGVIPFDSAKPIVVQADASQLGLGACLLQGNKLVTSSSRKLTETETHYAQIEKEMLALSFAATKFEKFIYGMPNVVFQTDHKPLVSIFAKPIYKITNNRLKKLRLNLMKFQPKVEYLPGKEMYLADLLSRNFLDDPVSDDPDMLEVVHEVTKHLSMAPEMKLEFQKETSLDPGLKAVMDYWQNGWPEDKHKVLPEAQAYWKLKEDLFVEDNLVIKEEKVLVPVSLRGNVLKKLHLAHLGIKKTKSRARQVLYWPGIDNEIENMIKECRICERNSPSNYKEKLIPHEVPDRRFQKVSNDICDFQGNSYLILVDNMSKWLEIKKLANKSSKAVIEAWREIFATHGIPETIFGDNNPFNSYECKEYAESIGSKIETSSPEYARSNGLGEK